MFTTIKRAMKAGYRERKAWEYGGEEITVKGRLLVRNPHEALSRTEWSKRGFNVRKVAQPHCNRSVYSTERGHISYEVYRKDQVEPKRQVSYTPANLIDLLSAVWVINRRAKRSRDLASCHYQSGTHGFARSVKNEKLELYRLKGRALHYLLAEGQLEIAGCHRFPGGNWAEVVKCGGYTFHRPCPHRTDGTAKQLDDIEAKPRESKEPRLKDALYSVKEFLKGKPKVKVFEWPQKVRTRPTRSSQHWKENDFGESEEDYEDSDFYQG